MLFRSKDRSNKTPINQGKKSNHTPKVTKNGFRPVFSKVEESTKNKELQESGNSKAESKASTASTEQELKERLAESLSPSPFRNEDPDKREARLEHLIASAPCTTKNLIFSPFYGNEIMNEGSHRAWKIALKDHIVHTLESICLIKKLNPVPLHIIEKRKANIKSLNTSIFIIRF